MAKIKLTKNELKLQRDSLKRFERYLPTLRLKQQQLQLETRQLRERMLVVRDEQADLDERTGRWIQVLDPASADILRDLLVVDGWRVSKRNVAGTDIPVFEGVDFRRVPYDLFATPLWFDSVLDAAREGVKLRLRLLLLEEQLRLLEHELRIVTQRVNLFEKVKIPESRENIRRIRIYLGDQQTSAVGRAKIAKGKCQAKNVAAAM